MTQQLQHRPMFELRRRIVQLQGWSDTRLRSHLAHLRHKLEQTQKWHDEELEKVVTAMLHGDWVVGERTIDMSGIFYASIAKGALLEAIKRLEAEAEARELLAGDVQESRKELPDAV